MLCPRCQKDMETITYHHVEVDQCPECSGIYLDKGELEEIAEKKIGNILDSTPLMKDDKPEKSGAAICPSCKKEMVVITGAGDVRFDWCMECEGIFFDQGELNILHYFQAD